MTNSKLTQVILQINGLVAILIGFTILLDPIAMLTPYGFQASVSTGLLSELRAPGGLLIVCGLMMSRYGFNSGDYRSGLQISIMVYGAYWSARMVGLLLDGSPPIEIWTAATIEFLLFFSSVLLMLKYRKESSYGH